MLEVPKTLRVTCKEFLKLGVSI